ncbi:MAG: hypothetical protein NTY59_00355 [Alphaproteobacteria bacterium]|nr:hypothetical protein [Alphaproteobacteria bacterium]
MNDFSPGGYRALLEAFRVRGYEVRGFADAEPSQRHLILRHDLDITPEAALPLAQIEAEFSMRASYFVLVRGELYNAFATPQAQAIAALKTLGHEIGLHLDASLYADDDAAIAAGAAAECAALEVLAGVAVRTISFHRPVARLVGRTGPIAGRDNTYEARFVTEIGYCSDSAGGWHRGRPLDHPAISAGRALQLLTHPIWWRGTTPQAALDAHLADEVARLDAALAANCKVHTPGRARLVR